MKTILTRCLRGLASLALLWQATPIHLQAAESPPNLLAYWDFDDATNPEVATDSVYGLRGMLEGGAVYSLAGEGNTGQPTDLAMDFGADNAGQMVRVAAADWLNLATGRDQMTVTFWQKLREVASSSAYWMDSPSSNNGNRGNQAHVPWSNGNIYFDTAGCCDVPAQRLSQAAEADFLIYHHFAFVKDGADKRVYIDGVLFMSNTGANPFPTDFVQMTIGGAVDGSNSIRGWIDEFAVFAGALDETAIAALASGTAPDALPGVEIIPPVAPTITEQPQDATVVAGGPVTFSVAASADAFPTPYFQWAKNGTAIDGATGSSYTIDRAPLTDNGAQFTCTVSNAGGSPTSDAATLTVNVDTIPPTLTFVTGSASFTQVVATFSEPLDQATAETAGNYSLSGGINVTGAVLSAPAGTPGDNIVILTTSQQAVGTMLTLTVNNVADVPGNQIAPGSTMDFSTFVWTEGFALHEFWQDVPNDIQGLRDDPRYPDSPTWVGIEPAVEYPANGGNEGGSNYGNRLSCWVTPPATGNYVFFVNSDDPSELWLSTDDDPAKVWILAKQEGWSDPRQWNSDLNKNSFDGAFSEWPGFVITLNAGQKYYLEVLHTEGGGGDNAAATMVSEDDFFNSLVQDGDAPTLTGAVIGTYLDPNGAVVDITEQPQDATMQEERDATFSVTATGSSAYGTNVSYQWQLNGVDIPGATGPSYTTPLLSMADDGNKYQVIITVPTLNVTSDEALLTVVPDTFPPQLAGAGAIMNGGAVEIGVGFDENVDETTAANTANYALSKGTVTGVRYQKYAHTDGAAFFQLGTAGPHNGAAVVLTTSGLAAGDTVTVTAMNVQDTKGNAMSAAGESVLARVTGKMQWVGMGGNDYLEGEFGDPPQDITSDPALWPDDVVALSDSDFDVISSGTANWNNYDESTFVYEEVTGDFDKVVRVEYHDPTSQWARAGMCATPNADAGVNRAAVQGGALQHRRYLNRVNPAVQWNGDPANNGFEANWRLMDGGNYGGVGASTPDYPNAWLRMQRIGQTFSSYWSNDGENWTQYGTQEFTDEPGTSELMPDTLLVGIYYTPEFGNNGTGEGVGHSSVAKFRQYGDYVETSPEITSIVLNADGTVTVEWTGGVLESAPTVNGPWTEAATEADSPLILDPTEAMLFGRIRQ